MPLASSSASGSGEAPKNRSSTPLWMATGEATPSPEATSSAANCDGQMTTAARRAVVTASDGSRPSSGNRNGTMSCTVSTSGRGAGGRRRSIRWTISWPR